MEFLDLNLYIKFEPGDDVHCWNFANGTVVSQISSMITDNQFVEIWNDLERLAKDEERGHANEDQPQRVLLLLFPQKRPSRLLRPSEGKFNSKMLCKWTKKAKPSFQM